MLHHGSVLSHSVHAFMTHMGHAFASTCAAIISRSAGDAHADALALRCRSIRWARRCGWRSKRPWCAALLYRRGWFCLLSRCMHTRKVHVLVFVAHRPCILILFRLISEESYELVSSPVLSNRTSNSTTGIMTPRCIDQRCAGHFAIGRPLALAPRGAAGRGTVHLAPRHGGERDRELHQAGRRAGHATSSAAASAAAPRARPVAAGALGGEGSSPRMHGALAPHGPAPS
jgi:hypothetical protein